MHVFSLFNISTVTDVEFTLLKRNYFRLSLRFITERDICIRINSKACRVVVIFLTVCRKDVMSMPLTLTFWQWIWKFKFLCTPYVKCEYFMNQTRQHYEIQSILWRKKWGLCSMTQKIQ